MSDPRLRFHFHPTGPLRLGHARIALFGALWVRSLGGKLVASNENRSALDDLEWLGIEPDAMVSRPKAERYDEIYEKLIEDQSAYPCFCGTAEAREMEPQPDSWPESHRYDGRCRGLRAQDKQALKKTREPGVRLRIGPEDSDISGINFDFLIKDAQNGPQRFFSRVVDEDNARCTHSVLPASVSRELPLQDQVRSTLGVKGTERLVMTSWAPEAADLPIQELRNEGYLPQAIIRALAQTSWVPPKEIELEDFVAKFNPKDILDSVAGPETKEELRSINAQVLAELDEKRLIDEVVSHLTLRGYPIAEQDRSWQERFVRTVRGELCTLGDAEELANHLLQDASEFDRSSLRRMPEGQLTTLLGHFESLINDLDEDTTRGWRSLIHKFRQEVPAPGRALSHIRVVMTGQPRGPSLASVLWLLGKDVCRDRIEKARTLIV